MKPKGWEVAAQAFQDFCVTVAALRHPDSGCPWDLEQDHRTLRQYMIEEAYEAAEVMAEEAPQELCEELGDVLLQVVLNAQIARDQETFQIHDVIHGINGKMRRRHPHVFGSAEDKAKRSVQEIKDKWQEIKAQEKAAVPASREAGKSQVFRKAYRMGPATLQAFEIGKIAAKNRFDWPNPKDVFDQVKSEMKELEEAMAEGNPEAIAEEIGDLTFSLAQLCRHLKLNPEINGLEANRKFLRRFALVEELVAADGKDIAKLTQPELETYWQKAKKEKGS